MERILLIAPHIIKNWDYRKYYDMAAPPMGLLSIGTVLEKNGFKVDIINASLSPDYLKKIEAALRKKPLLAGISAMTSQVASGREIARFVRGLTPEIPIVWGGIHPTLRPHECLKHADIVCVGEAVESIIETRVDEGSWPY